MEEYIGNCLNSLLIKEQFDNLEIIVVNDGSKDKSLNIALQYQKKYPQSIKVIDKQNGNYGSCVNRGLKEATGKYIKILDSDDTFNTETLQNLIKILNEINVDAVFTDYVIVNKESIVKFQSNYSFPTHKPFKFNEYCNNEITMKQINMHTVMYKRENLITINYHQTEGISYTDQEWVFLPVLTISTAFYYEYPLYQYLIGRDGQTMDENIFTKNINQLAIVILSLIKNYTEQNLTKSSFQKKYSLCRILGELDIIYQTYLFRNYQKINELINLDNKIKEMNKEIYLRSNDITINKSFKYIAYWRKHKNMIRLPYILNFNYRIYILHKSIKKFLKKIL